MKLLSRISQAYVDELKIYDINETTCVKKAPSKFLKVPKCLKGTKSFFAGSSLDVILVMVTKRQDGSIHHAVFVSFNQSFLAPLQEHEIRAFKLEKFIEQVKIEGGFHE